MEQVYIRSRSRSAPQSTPSTTVRRQWDVSIRVNNLEEAHSTIVDPFLEGEYLTIFEKYLRDSDRPKWSPRRLAAEEGDEYEFTRKEDDIQSYALALLDGLDLDTSCFSPGATECHVYVIQHYAEQQVAANRPDINCLAWELLEQLSIPDLPKLRFRVTRISDFSTPTTLHRPYRILQSLASVQADTSRVFKILLVVARDFSRTGAERDPEPDLAQWPLMSVQKKLRSSRMLLEVVRPGSVEELGVHLRMREEQGVRFNLVHFDLHGRITEDRHGNREPSLLFAGHHPTGPSSGIHPPQTSLASASTVATLLAAHRIENVVLNACLSAYNHAGPATNLAHTFLRHGVRRVSAMWFYVHWQTVATYLETFYSELLVKCMDFEKAAQSGREAVRRKPTSRTGKVYQDFFLCVNYSSEIVRPTATTVAGARGSSPGSIARRDPSPAPSVRSQDSSTSNTSIKSFKSGLWKPPTPRLGDGTFLTSVVGGDTEPVMRMRLHLLELEYKLLTSRIVYASDLRRADSKLSSSVEKLVGVWLATHLIDEVHYYRGKDFGKRRVLKEMVPAREKKTRASPGSAGSGYLSTLLFHPRPVRALRPSLHIIRDLDAVLDPGMQADEVLNAKSEERRLIAQENLQRFTERILADAQGSLVLVLGSNDAQWWRTYLQHLGGEWWVHMPWGFVLHSRHRGPGGGRKGLTMLGMPG